MSPSLWVMIEKLSQQAVWLVLFAILAPILGPRPYGLFAIVMVFVGFCEFVGVEAAAEALIGMDPLEPLHLKTATSGNLAIAIPTGIAVFLLAPLFGRLFGDPELTRLFRALSVLPAISALTSAPLAVLKRRMDFRPLAIRSTLGLAIGGIAGVALALTGAGVWSLVWQILVQRIAELAILRLSAGSAAGIGLGWSRSHYHDLRDYAGHVFVSRSTAFIGGQLPRVIIGYFLGPVDLGLFTLASRLAETLIQIAVAPRAIVARVDLRRFRRGEAALEAAFHRLLRDIALIGFPMSFGAVATIPLLFSVWLDRSWQGGIWAAEMMLLTVPPLAVFYAASSVLLALNFPRREARISVLQSVSTALFVLAAAPLGLDAVCLVMVVRLFLLMPYPALVVWRACGISPRSMAAAVAPPFCLSVAMAAVVTAISPLVVRSAGPRVALAGLIVIGGLVYALLVGLFAPNEVRRFVAGLGSKGIGPLRLDRKGTGAGDAGRPAAHETDDRREPGGVGGHVEVDPEPLGRAGAEPGAKVAIGDGALQNS
jgi:O-antigen/teichoic acid export membrane protein